MRSRARLLVLGEERRGDAVHGADVVAPASIGVAVEHHGVAFGVASDVGGVGASAYRRTAPTVERLRIPVKVITDSGLNVISESGQSGHRSERSDAGVGL